MCGSRDYEKIKVKTGADFLDVACCGGSVARGRRDLNVARTDHAILAQIIDSIATSIFEHDQLPRIHHVHASNPPDITTTFSTMGPRPRHLSELLLRPATLTRISAPRPSPIRCLRLPQPQPTPWALPSTRRHLNTTPPTHAAQPQLKEEEALDTPAEDNSELTSEIDTLFGLAKNIRRGPFRAPNSGDELEATRRMFGSEFSSPDRGTSLRPQAFNFDDLNMPDEPVEPVQAITIPEEDIKYPRLNPAYGRTVNLDESKGRDIVRGINMLASLMARNKVKQDFNKQRYHERPGLKRKRLNSERWRARFKVGFNGVVGRVSELTRKGW